MAFVMEWLGDFLAALRRSRVSLKRLVSLIPESSPKTLVRGGVPSHAGADSRAALRNQNK